MTLREIIPEEFNLVIIKRSDLRNPIVVNLLDSHDYYKFECSITDEQLTIRNKDSLFGIFNVVTKITGARIEPEFKPLDLENHIGREFYFPNEIQTCHIERVLEHETETRFYTNINWWVKQDGLAGGFEERPENYGLRELTNKTVLYDVDSEKMTLSFDDGQQFVIDSENKLEVFIAKNFGVFKNNNFKIEKEQCLPLPGLLQITM